MDPISKFWNELIDSMDKQIFCEKTVIDKIDQ